jgi:hypothetical protein
MVHADQSASNRLQITLVSVGKSKMGNKDVARACEILRVYENLNDMKEFWEKFGRRDLIGRTRADFIGAPVLQEIASIAERITRSRITIEKEIEWNGEKMMMKVQCYPRMPGPKPLTRFLTIESGRRYSYFLRETKGWRRQIVDDREFALYQKAGWKLLKNPPKVRYGRRRA